MVVPEVDTEAVIEVDPSGAASTADDREEPPPSAPTPRRPPSRFEPGRAEALAKEVQARPTRIETPCAQEGCAHRALDKLQVSLAELERGERNRVRILHLGDSHIAADYITGTIRRELQARFGDAGRGFVAVDQRSAYGGRRIERTGFKRTRIVDTGSARSPFGFSGMALESRRPGAEVTFALERQDAQVTIFYLAHPGGAQLNAYVGDALIGEVDTRSRSEESRTKTWALPALDDREDDRLTLEATGPGAKFFGLSFETKLPGVLYDAIGPVGADARVYLSLDPKSLREHLQRLAPDLIVLMIGGNDALAIRQGHRTLEEVRHDHEFLVRALREAVPSAECLLWSPMDAGERDEDAIVSKAGIAEVRRVQAGVAKEQGCAFWDMFESMGGSGAFGRWYAAGIMNEDLIHPRAAAGELLGELFSKAFLELYTRAPR